MTEFSARNCWKLWALIATAVGCLAPTGVFAGSVPVTFYVNVNPIDVCDSLGCPPINNQNQTAATNPSTTNIGFTDPTTNIDVTRALLNQAGIDLVWGPVQQFNSPPKAAGSTETYDTLRTIDTTTTTNPCPFPNSNGATDTGLTSCDLMTLSQQPSISGGTVPRTTIPKGVPVSSNLTTINLFIVRNLLPPPQEGGTLYGLGWINNNGVAIGSNTFLAPNGPRFETIAHEILHNLALTHKDFGAGPSYNLETSGDARTSPSTIGCSAPSNPSNPFGGALYDLNTGLCGTGVGPSNPIAEQLTLVTSGGTCNSILSTANPPCNDQQGAADLSGFLNPISNQTTTATTTCKKNCPTAATASGPSPFDNISSGCTIQFTLHHDPDVSGSIYLVKAFIMPPPGFQLINNTFRVTSSTVQGPVSNAFISKGELVITMTGPPHQYPPSGNTRAELDFVQGISQGGSCNYSAGSLMGMELALQTSDGLLETMVYTPNGFGVGTGTGTPDLTKPLAIVIPNFVGAHNNACTIPNDFSATDCPDTRKTGVEVDPAFIVD